MNTASPQLLSLLKQYFGFSSFRPLQEEIIRDTLAGRDVFAVLPTGGGKSLCFQLPALAREGLTVVVSPLIALMKDQVDSLQAAGVPATFLNSSLAAGESRPRLRGLHNGEFRLLYVAPERLLLSGFLEDLQKWNVNLFAIDEAHCISEWGHDFRPEYRQIASLRTWFPKVPLMALTATATERVRGDILEQVRLRDPACYIASFNRPNLTYRVSSKAGAYRQVWSFLRDRPREGGIIYCQARKTTETLAAKLSADGIASAPYHAGLTAKERSANQEAFLRDELRVICATIAFGMGINKPNVRFVIHYDLPKNIEGYYQETGRAGRDGLPSECLLLFSPGDRVKQARFIDEKPDPKEREIARAQLEQIVHYAEEASCRRAFLLGYFGEKFTGNAEREDGDADAGQSAAPHPDPLPQEREQPERPVWSQNATEPKTPSSSLPLPQGEGRGEGKEIPRKGDPVDLQNGAESETTEINCGGCDNCLAPRATFDGTVAAQKFLSCVYRIRQQSGFGVGIQHVVEVLCGAETEKIRKWDHQKLSTYSIGTEHSRAEWAAIGRELVRLGYLMQNANHFNVAELTEEGRAFLRARRKITLTEPMAAPEPVKHRAGEIACDELLFDKLRALRKQLADEWGVPSYIIFGDVTLRQMARFYPQSGADLSRISGVGEKKRREFGEVFLAEIVAHLRVNPRQMFADDSFGKPAPPPRSKLTDTVMETLRFFRQGKTVAAIAKIRGVKEDTIYSHLETGLLAGEELNVRPLLDAQSWDEIATALKSHEGVALSPVFEALGGRYSYGQLRLVRAAEARGL